MIDFFKTASGAYNYVLIVSLIAWIVSGLGILAGLHKHRTDTLSAVKARQNAEKAQKEEEDRRIMAESRLATAEQEIVKLRPKPLKVRVVDFLNRLDSSIIPALKNGQTEFRYALTYAQLAELQSLVHEDSHGTFIAYVPSTNIIMNEPGKVGDQRFRVSAEVAK